MQVAVPYPPSGRISRRCIYPTYASVDVASTRRTHQSTSHLPGGRISRRRIAGDIPGIYPAYASVDAASTRRTHQSTSHLPDVRISRRRIAGDIPGIYEFVGERKSTPYRIPANMSGNNNDPIPDMSGTPDIPWSTLSPIPDGAPSSGVTLSEAELMAATTHEDVMHHVLQAVLEGECQDLEAFCLQLRIRKMSRLLGRPKEELAATAFVDEDTGEKDKYLSRDSLDAIEALRLWYDAIPSEQRLPKSWLLLSAEDFEVFFCNEFLPWKRSTETVELAKSKEEDLKRLETKAKAPAPPAPPAIVSPSKLTPREAFDKRHKVAMDEYSELNKRTEYHDWIDDVETNFKADQMECLLDPKYKPADADHAALFVAIQARGMRMVKKKVKFLDGTNIMDECKNDAQKFFEKLHIRCATGIYGEQTARSIERELQNMPFSADRDQSGNSKFLAKWKQKYTNYERARETAGMGPHLTNDAREWLIQSLSQHADTKDITTTVETMEAMNKKRLTFAEFMELIDTTLEQKDARDRKQRETQPKNQLAANLAEQSKAKALRLADPPPADPLPLVARRTRTGRNSSAGARRRQQSGLALSSRRRTDGSVRISQALSKNDKADWTRRYSEALAKSKTTGQPVAPPNRSQIAYTAQIPAAMRETYLSVVSPQSPTRAGGTAARAAAAAAAAAASAPAATIPTGQQHLTTMLSASQARTARAVNAAAAARQQGGNVDILQGSDGQQYAVVDGQVRRINMANRHIHISNGEIMQRLPAGATMIDSGANGGLASTRDFEILELSEALADVTGVSEGDLTDLRVGLGATLTHDINGNKVILYCPQYAFYDGDKSIHSKSQLQAAGADVDDVSVRAPVPGRQFMICGDPDRTIIPFAVRSGLTYMDTRKPTIARDGRREHSHYYADPGCLETRRP